jgi:hypothetical protein
VKRQRTALQRWTLVTMAIVFVAGIGFFLTSLADLAFGLGLGLGFTWLDVLEFLGFLVFGAVLSASILKAQGFFEK